VVKIHTHGSLNDLWGSLNCHISVFDLVVVLVSHLSEVWVDVVEALLVFLEDQVVVILVHLRDLSLSLEEGLLFVLLI
jgi:hypothetical protein